MQVVGHLSWRVCWYSGVVVLSSTPKVVLVVEEKGRFRAVALLRSREFEEKLQSLSPTTKENFFRSCLPELARDLGGENVRRVVNVTSLAIGLQSLTLGEVGEVREKLGKRLADVILSQVVIRKKAA